MWKNHNNYNRNSGGQRQEKYQEPSFVLHNVNKELHTLSRLATLRAISNLLIFYTLCSDSLNVVLSLRLSLCVVTV